MDGINMEENEYKITLSDGTIVERKPNDPTEQLGRFISGNGTSIPTISVNELFRELYAQRELYQPDYTRVIHNNLDTFNLNTLSNVTDDQQTNGIVGSASSSTGGIFNRVFENFFGF